MEYTNIYVLRFKVTKTNSCGSETRFTKTVNVRPLENGKHRTEEQQKAIAMSVMSELNLYDIEYIDTKTSKVY